MGGHEFGMRLTPESWREGHPRITRGQWDVQRTLYDADHEAYRGTVRQFLAKEVVPHYEKWEEAALIDREVWRSAGKTGLLGLLVAEEYGGDSPVVPASGADLSLRIRSSSLVPDRGVTGMIVMGRRSRKKTAEITPRFAV